MMAMLCLATTAFSLLARYWWLADLIANLRIPLIIGLIFLVSGLLAARQNRLAACVTLALIWHCSWITPYLFAPQKPIGVRPLKICTVNVLTQNSQHAKVLAVLKMADPDVIAVLELGTSLESQLNTQLSDLYPHRIAQPRDDGNFGIGLWSKLPLQEEQIFHLTVPLVSSTSAKVSWEGGASGSTIVVGDLNLAPWYGKFLADAGLEDCIRGDQMAALSPTWYRWTMFPFGLVLDHGFCGGGLESVGRCGLRPSPGLAGVQSPPGILTSGSRESAEK